MPLSHRPSPVTLVGVTKIDKPGEAIPTVILMECAPRSGQELFGPVRPELQSKVAITEEFVPATNMQACVLPSSGGTQLEVDWANAGEDTDKQHAKMLM